MEKQKTTFFGMPIVREVLIPLEEIKKLPFYDFWYESAVGSTTLLEKDGSEYVYLHDWENFSRLFIKTGKHRNMPGVF